MRKKWQPINTAPKDGKRVLIAWPAPLAFRIYVGYWSGDWREAYDHNILVGEEAPSHWMPLPEPPK